MQQRDLLEKAARLRDEAQEQLRIAATLSLPDDRASFKQYADELRKQATELERQAAAMSPPRLGELSRDTTKDEPNPKKGRGGSNDPDPQV
jgi:hypothetical protein